MQHCFSRFIRIVAQAALCGLLALHTVGCTEAAHASIWVSTDSGIQDVSTSLVAVLHGLDWREEPLSKAGEVIFRNERVKSAYVRLEASVKEQTELIFVVVGATRFSAQQEAEYRLLSNRLIEVRGGGPVKTEEPPHSGLTPPSSGQPSAAAHVER